MDEEQLKILEMVANKTITPEEAAKLLEAKKLNQSNESYTQDSQENDDFTIDEKEYSNEEQIDVSLELGVTNFKLFKCEPDKIYKIEHNKADGSKHYISFNHNELQVKNDIKPAGFDLFALKKFVDPSRKKCSVGLNENTKIYMKVKFGGGKADLDFTDLRLKRLRLSSGASDTKISFKKLNPEELDYLKIESGASNIDIHGLANSNCTDMDFNLGACNAILDFSGDLKKDLYAELSMRVGKLTLLVPKEFGVKIKISDKLANLNLPDFSLREGYRVSENIDTVDKCINFRIDSTLAQVNLTWI